MSDTVPTAPVAPADEVKSLIQVPDSKPDAPPAYSPYLVPGPQGPAVPPPAALPAGMPVVYYSPQQPTTFPLHQPGNAAPVQYQPGRYPAPRQTPVTWMPGPTPMPDCLPGLELLTQLDSIHVLQHFQPVERVVNFEMNNRYDVRNDENQMVYTVNEDTDDYTRNVYKGLRPFVLRVTDALGREVMTMQRPFKCTVCCYCCCPSTRQEMEVQCPPGVTLGFIREQWRLCRALFSIQNEKREAVMSIRGPCATYRCCSSSVFQVTSLEGVSTGSITKKWTGLMTEVVDADHFEIQFPLDLDVKKKAMIFAASFLIDFMYFERSAESYHQSRRHHH